MAGRLTCTEDGSSKFWEGVVEGASLTTRWGKVGTAGQAKTKVFASAEAAEKELAKLRKEKLGKGYVEEGGTGDLPPSASAPVTPKATPKAGKYTTALFALLRSLPKRDGPSPLLESWLAKERRADLRGLFELVRDHDPAAASVGDFSFWGNAVGGRVPRRDDGAQDRDDVVSVGVSPGGDLFVVAAPGTSDDTVVTEVLHDEGWSNGEAWHGLEDFLQDQVQKYRERCLEDGDDEDDIHTDLDPFLTAPRSAAERTVAGHGLALAAGAEPARARLVSGDKAQQTRLREVFNQLRGSNYGTYGWYEDFWHGAHAFGLHLSTFERDACLWIDLSAVQERLDKLAKTTDVYRAMILERAADSAVARVIDPAIIAAWATDANYESTLPYAFTQDGASLLVSGGSAFKVVVDSDGTFGRELVGGGAVHVVAPSSGVATRIREHQGEDDVLAVGWLGDRAAVLRRAKKSNVLELFARGEAGWSLSKTVSCGKCDALFGLGAGAAVLTSSKKSAKARTFFLGARGDDVRLLGAVDGILKNAVTLPDGRSFVEEPGERWSELLHLDGAIETAFAAAATDLVLA